MKDKNVHEIDVVKEDYFSPNWRVFPGKNPISIFLINFSVMTAFKNSLIRKAWTPFCGCS
jgi:hypothetical protein